MDSAEALRNISKIIQREDKTSTYKFALLRGTIEIVQENSPFIQQKDEVVIIPIGLLVEKWLYYYYPLFQKSPPVPQIRSSMNLAIGPYFTTVVEYYEQKGSLSKLRNDLHLGKVPKEVCESLESLILKIQETIVKMPMLHLGSSVHGGTGQVFRPLVPRSKRNFEVKQGISSMIHHLGSFTIPKPYFEAFSLYGSFISGQDNLLVQWAALSEKFSGVERKIKAAQVFGMLSKTPVLKRKNSDAQYIFEEMDESGKLKCVWTGTSPKKWDVDHLLPFSVWKNNDLWNMLPCDSAINGNKSDNVPDQEALSGSKERIIWYWREIHSRHPHQFQEEITVALLGSAFKEGWEEVAFQRLEANCKQMIEQRGHNPWKP